MNAIMQGLLQQIMPEEANRPVMGQGDYTPVKGQPLGWDYDTLVSALTEMGYPNLDQEMSDNFMLDIMQELEHSQADSNDKAIPILMQMLESRDPNNKFAGHLPALSEDSPGYWDAAQAGNGRGKSFINYPQGMEDPRTVMADPVGNGAPSREQMRGGVEAVSDGHLPGIEDMDQAQLINAFLEAFGGR